MLDVIEGALAADQVGALLARLRQIVGVHQRLEILDGRDDDAVAAADDARPLLAQDHLAGNDVPVEQGLARTFDRGARRSRLSRSSRVRSSTNRATCAARPVTNNRNASSSAQNTRLAAGTDHATNAGCAAR